MVVGGGNLKVGEHEGVVWVHFLEFVVTDSKRNNRWWKVNVLVKCHWKTQMC